MDHSGALRLQPAASASIQTPWDLGGEQEWVRGSWRREKRTAVLSHRAEVGGGGAGAPSPGVWGFRATRESWGV